MKFLFVNPNWDFAGSTYFGCRDPHIPLELMFAYDKVREAGHEPLLVDAQTDELSEVYGRLKAADRPVLEEGRTTCCYAKSEKSWIADPDGILWRPSTRTGRQRPMAMAPR